MHESKALQKIIATSITIKGVVEGLTQMMNLKADGMSFFKLLYKML